jgi:hypothetical protein
MSFDGLTEHYAKILGTIEILARCADRNDRAPNSCKLIP